jgi:chlorobactene glucosyltransferase
MEPEIPGVVFLGLNSPGCDIVLIAFYAWPALVAWLIVRAFTQRKLLQALAIASPPPSKAASNIAVIIPCRDEEANIGLCLCSLLKQSYPAERFAVLVVDDHSTDATVSIAKAMAQSHSCISVLRSPPLPQHWTGKSHACWIGALAAPPETEWLCFLDADMRAGRDLLASAAASVQSERLDLLSLAPRHELGSFAERLIIPCGLYFLAFRQDLRKLQSPEGDDVTATGQFLLVRRSAYVRAGGHETVREHICEDVALARLLKSSGAKVALRDGTRALSTRMYRGWRTLWPGLAKNLVDVIGGPIPAISAALVAIVLAWTAWLIPIAAGVSCLRGAPGGCLALVPALAGSAAAIGLHIAGAAYFRIPLWYGLIFPIGYTACAVMAMDSVRRRLRGRVSWKGRTYP